MSAIACALEPGPASFAALRAAAEIACRTGSTLRGYGLAEGGIPTLRALRRLRVAGRRRALETSFVQPFGGDLLATSEAARDARLLVVGRGPSTRLPGLVRRLLLARLIRASGPPVLIVPRRGRPLGDRVLLACANGAREAVLPFYGALRPLVARLSVLRFLDARGELATDGELDACIDGAASWDERIVHADEGHDLPTSVASAAERTRPTLVAIDRPASGPGFAALFAPEAADRLLAETHVPVLVARAPAATASSLAA